MAEKNRNDTNPEIIYEQNKKQAKDFYERNEGEIRLFPDFFPGVSVSGTESTGLIQVAPITPELQRVYDDVYSYRKTEDNESEGIV